MKRNERGITLIALIITVIILLILAGTAVSIAIDGNSLFGKTQTAKEQWNIAVETEETSINSAMNILNSMNGITMTLDGVEVKGITKDNFGEYLGKVVTNYAPTATTVSYTPQVEGTTEQTYTVSNRYRLYWIDWDNKYGDGAGTIYLKADCTNNRYALWDSSKNVLNGTAETSKIEQLNPSIYVGGVTSPASTNENISAIRWLTDTTVWSSLKNGLTTEIINKINYIVGDPSVEMMIDSYNKHYESVLTGTTSPDYSNIAEGERRKLWYKFTSGEYGYNVGPDANHNVEYEYRTSDNSVARDQEIGTTYYAGDSNSSYWLASPAGGSSLRVMRVNSYTGGYVSYSGYGDNASFCPVVSLKPDVQL